MGRARSSWSVLGRGLLRRTYVRSHPRLLGAAVARRYGALFPLLVKLIEVNTMASLQVHPDDAQAQALEGFPFGKSEAWYIIDAPPTAEIYVGFTPGTTRERFSEELARGNARALLAPVSIRPGDCIALDPGTVHACGNGVLLLEVQQSCDITYRVYDWDRVDARGRKRQLHVEKALQVIDFAAAPRISRSDGSSNPAPLLNGRHFKVFEARVRGALVLQDADRFVSLTVVRGACRLSGGGAQLALPCGATVLVPAGIRCALEGEEALLVGAAPAV
jgi:mannose-6-phosphate isomerase